MKLKKLNNNGFGFLDLVVGLVLIGILVTITYNFNHFVFKTKMDTMDHFQLNNNIINTVTEAYNTKDWENIQDTQKKVNGGILDIRYSYQGLTEYNTDKLMIDFELKDKRQTFNIERSVYDE